MMTVQHIVSLCQWVLARTRCAKYDFQHSLAALLLGLCIASIAPAGFAVEPEEMLDDPALEARAQAIGAEVRCLVCRNESIEDSNADLAKDLRLVVRERLVAGDSDEAVYAFLVERFGEYVLLRPRFGGSTLWLWLAGPALLLVGAGIALGFVLKGRRDVAALSDDEEARLRGLLDDEAS